MQTTFLWCTSIEFTSLMLMKETSEMTVKDFDWQLNILYMPTQHRQQLAFLIYGPIKPNVIDR